MLGQAAIGVAEAARKLDVSAGTVRNWLHIGRIRGERGEQPSRPRWRVFVDGTGQPIGEDGSPVPSSRRDSDLEHRVADLERRLASPAYDPRGDSNESFRDAALQLNTVMEHQRRAFQLQLEATKALELAVAEQAAIISGLLVGDPSNAVDARR
jgi:predicted site-specific integrase-resolvase